MLSCHDDGLVCYDVTQNQPDDDNYLLVAESQSAVSELKCEPSADDDEEEELVPDSRILSFNHHMWNAARASDLSAPPVTHLHAFSQANQTETLTHHILPQCEDLQPRFL